MIQQSLFLHEKFPVLKSFQNIYGTVEHCHGHQKMTTKQSAA